MKLIKNSNILFVGLALVLSLVSFTGVSNHIPSEATKTALVVRGYSADMRYAISYQNVIKNDSDTITTFSEHAFTAFQNNYNLKVNSAFKRYTNKTLGLSAKQLHIKLYALSTLQTIYNDIV